jgi:hypothetical protein
MLQQASKTNLDGIQNIIKPMPPNVQPKNAPGRHLMANNRPDLDGLFSHTMSIQHRATSRVDLKAIASIKSLFKDSLNSPSSFGESLGQSSKEPLKINRVASKIPSDFDQDSEHSPLPQKIVITK